MRRMCLVLAVVLAACGSGGSDEPGDDWQRIGEVSRVRPVTVDGVRCIAMRGPSSAAISCDWSQR